MKQSGYKLPRWAKVLISSCIIGLFLLALAIVMAMNYLDKHNAITQKIEQKKDLKKENLRLRSQAEFCTKEQGDRKCLRFAFGYPQVVKGVISCTTEQYIKCYPYLCQLRLDVKEPVTKQEREASWKLNCDNRLPTANEMPDWAEYYFFGRMP